MEPRAEGEGKYRSAFMAMAEGVVFQTADGTITDVNPAAERIEGRTAGQMTGRIPDDLHQGSIHEDGSAFPGELHPSMVALRSGEPQSDAVMGIHRPDGSLAWISISSWPLTAPGESKPHAVVTTFHDVTESRKGEWKYRILFEESFDGLFITSPAGKILEMNKKGIMLFGYDRKEEILDLDLARDIYEKPEDRKRILALVDTMGTAEYDVVVKKKSGDTMVTHCSLTAVKDERGEVALYMGAIRDITDHNRVESELTDSRTQLRNLATHLLSAREEERRKVAREIHDELGQVLTALKMDLKWLEKRLVPLSGQLQEKIGGMIGLTDQTIRRVQKISAELRPRMLDDLGLDAAVDWLSSDFSRRTGIACTLTEDLGKKHLGEDVATALYRIVQEALTNIARHAEASQVAVDMRVAQGRIEVSVQDDGIGISEEQAADPHSLGLIGIRERVLAFGGETSITGEKGKGTSIRVAVPLPRDGAPA